MKNDFSQNIYGSRDVLNKVCIYSCIISHDKTEDFGKFTEFFLSKISLKVDIISLMLDLSSRLIARAKTKRE